MTFIQGNCKVMAPICALSPVNSARFVGYAFQISSRYLQVRSHTNVFDRRGLMKALTFFQRVRARLGFGLLAALAVGLFTLLRAAYYRDNLKP